ncbi:MAG: ATP-binding cassette domain-containing protein [Planctomycetota bacterium]|jgi:ABC-2 type transport system ATP-binding protein|nr:ATP-binding cassette domain-containing protein [Planctomycetota bacterium]
MADHEPDFMIEVNELSKYYGTFPAVKNISFNVPRAQVCAFLGPNGAGKSTTMKLLTGFIAPTSGGIKVANYDIATDRIKACEHIGYLPENGPLYNEMTPSSSLKYLAKVRGLSISQQSERVEYVAEKCDLKDVWHKGISKLSKGFRQRVGMAQALLHDPDVLILDEPTSGLDPNQLVGIRQLIKDLGQSKTVLLSTHILQEVEKVCGHVILIDAGQIRFNGSTSELTDSDDIEKSFHQLTEFEATAVH